NDSPKVTALLSAYPNPFNPTTTIRFTLESSGHVAVRVYDAGGRLVRTLSDESMPAGRHSLSWNGRDNAGRQAATGVYFVHMRAGSYEATKKIVLLK
ncbi:MAG: T9SS type A sorting domain-containing protein, partial [Planctomycetes bacterium]|nr:T9SS type A sorting domain-containing protein [Planctomycetota bacterium]